MPQARSRPGIFHWSDLLFFVLLFVDVSVDVPDELDLTSAKGNGLQAGEQELPEESSEAAAPPGEIKRNFSSLTYSMCVYVYMYACVCVCVFVCVCVYT